VPLAHKLQQLIDDLAILDDPQERLAIVVDRAKKIPPLSPPDRVDGNRVRGCVSVVWLVGELREGRCYFRFDAESPVVRGLLALLCEFYSGTTPAQIIATDTDPLESLELLQNLSPTRRNGLAAARSAIRSFAQNAAGS
jgi:cysteine desulfuration protein SufE